MELRHADALLLGGGVAAARCARALRRGGFAGSILLVGEERDPPYNRPPLSKELLRGEVPEELVLAEPPTWYERRGVELLLGTPAVALDPGARRVELADGVAIHYDRLLLAMGAAPRPLPVPGGERARLLRTLPDAVALRGAAEAGERGVVIGGGFIGVEVAAALAERGMAVTLLERADGLWAGSLGDAVSAWAVDRLAGRGVAVRLGARVSELPEDAVLLRREEPDGREALPAPLVVAGIGVAPRVSLAEAAGLAVDDGIVVDERQATSDGAIFAAGDVARPDGAPRVEHWHAARESGERAALAMLGGPVPRRRAPWVFSEFGGASLDVVGAALPGDEQVPVEGGVAWLRDGRPSQLAILDGAIPVEEARALLERGGDLAELRRLGLG